MDTQSLQTFLMLSKLKNFSLTAEKLFVNYAAWVKKLVSSLKCNKVTFLIDHVIYNVIRR